MPNLLSTYPFDKILAPEARSPSGKAKVCKTFIGGSIPPRASKVMILPASTFGLSLLFDSSEEFMGKFRLR